MKKSIVFLSFVSLIITITAFFLACMTERPKQAESLSGDLIIFHAGSLSVPIKEISKAFKQENPDANIMLEAAGSVECARKITDLKRPCDVMASADYTVIDKMLIPEFADWNIKFASNEMAIVFTGKSRKSTEITATNWYNILLGEDVQIGRADPNSDPCGYRTVLVTKLAESYYQQKGLSEKLLEKGRNNMRPKETDLLALLETGNVDFIFLYKSVAEQHKLKYILLPDDINLKNPDYAGIYNSATVEINGKSPDEKITQRGEPMVYGITIPRNTQNKPLAFAFVKFLLSKEKGIAILEKSGQPSMVPSETNTYNNIPAELKAFALLPNE
jgi:molybdate/tungstate transport system substrate-binding protein